MRRWIRCKVKVGCFVSKAEKIFHHRDIPMHREHRDLLSSVFRLPSSVFRPHETLFRERSFHISLKDFGATRGISRLSPHCFLKKFCSTKFFVRAPPLFISLRLSMAFFQKRKAHFSDVAEYPCSTESRRLNKSNLCRSIFTGQTSVHLPQSEEAKLRCLNSSMPL